MALDIDFDLDLSGDKIKELDRGGEVDAGWYRACLMDVYKDVKGDQLVFKFQICEGEMCAGQMQFFRLQDPELADSADKVKRAYVRVKSIATRLGLIDEEDEGKTVQGSWTEAIGNEYWLHVVARDEEEKDSNGKKTGRKTGKQFIGIDYLGIYPLDHDKVPAAVRGVDPNADPLEGTATPPQQGRYTKAPPPPPNVATRTSPAARTAPTNGNGNGGVATATKRPSALDDI